MKAKVRDIKVDTVVSDNYGSDCFALDMKVYVGEILTFTKRKETWYSAVTVGFAWHISWLDFDYDKKPTLATNSSIRSLRRQI